ncbi:MAG: SpoIID/LytB domain-containing protein, partial [Cyanobacteriota bacterium]|nr:SpoIID/LytB domain-containing protein [Cyanobacteriota bacterium]
YLVAVPDFDEASPVRQWQERFAPEQLRQLLPETGGLQRLTVSSRSSAGRVRQVLIEGPLGSLTLSGAQLRKRLGLRSTWIEIELIQAPTPSPIQAPTQMSVQPAELGALEVLPPPPLTPSWSSPSPLAQPLAALVIRGRGYGHGIGMSQWGAYGLARRGASHDAILSHYYPGTQLDAYLGP